MGQSRPMAVIERLNFVGVPTQDPERSRAFYRGVLGLHPDEHAEWVGSSGSDPTSLGSRVSPSHTAAGPCCQDAVEDSADGAIRASGPAIGVSMST